VWSVTSAKPGNGVDLLRDDSLETYWQSDGAQPHLVNIQFQKKVSTLHPSPFTLNPKP
jgi:anaphase-promoting complex subunit 10